MGRTLHSKQVVSSRPGSDASQVSLSVLLCELGMIALISQYWLKGLYKTVYT